ncbi:hypothetical protein [Plantactinospora sp. CA-290183]|uniref:hypothetical protein n=1 Tax=Plantactinospora sp. CA-290183 TaxID=3240006 RepID=UPI003D915EC0
MYEEELPLTGAVLAAGGATFDTWWIAIAGVTLVVTATTLVRLARRVRPPARR